MAETVYVLCAATSIVCAWLLLRGYRASRIRLLFWACLCFVFLAANNVLLFLDLVIFVRIDLWWLRTSIALAGLVVLVCGLVWESQ